MKVIEAAVHDVGSLTPKELLEEIGASPKEMAILFEVLREWASDPKLAATIHFLVGYHLGRRSWAKGTQCT